MPNVRDCSGGDVPDGSKWMPGECDVPFRDGVWMWQPNTEDRLFSLDQLMDKYYRSVGRNCNLLLNVNPDKNVLVPSSDMARYREFGDEIRRRFGQSLAETGGEGCTVTLPLKQKQVIDHVMLMEEIIKGERIHKYVVEAQSGGTWQKIGGGSCIGHKRIERITPVLAEAVRLTVLESIDTPLIRKFAVYNTDAS